MCLSSKLFLSHRQDVLFKLCCLKSEIIEVQECAPRKHNLGNNPAGLSGVVQCFPPVLKVISPMLTMTEE